MFSINIKSKETIYEQLYNNIISLVALGVLKKEDKLPTVRAMASELGVNPNTVSKAYQLLERDSIIYTVSGRGAFISEDCDINQNYKKPVLKDIETTVIKGKAYGVEYKEIIEIIDKIYKLKGR